MLSINASNDIEIYSQNQYVVYC